MADATSQRRRNNEKGSDQRGDHPHHAGAHYPERHPCQQQERITAYRKRRSRSSLQRAFKLVYEYIEHLYTVESSFLSDLRHKVAYAEHFDEHREFWRSELTVHLNGSREEKLLLPEIDASSFADRILETIFEMRINNATREESYLFCRTILRGAATREGVERIDSHR